MDNALKTIRDLYDEQNEKLTYLQQEVRRKDEELRNLRRQIECIYDRLNRLSGETLLNNVQDSLSISPTVPVPAGSKKRTIDDPMDGSGGSSPKRTRNAHAFPFVKHPRETLIDVFSLLDRWQLDSVQFTCRRFRLVVDHFVTLVCLRPLSNVAFRRAQEETALERRAYALHTPEDYQRHQPRVLEGDFHVPQVQGVTLRSRHPVPASQPRQPQPTVYQVSVAYTQKNHPLRYRNSKVRKDVGWTELNQEQGEALEFFLGLVKASSIGTLTFENVMFAERFFYELMNVAPTVVVDRFIIDACQFTSAPAGDFKSSILRFAAIRAFSIERCEGLLAAHITDDFIVGAGENGTSMVSFDARPKEQNFEVTDDGILTYMFRDSEEKTELRAAYVPISGEFSKKLLEAAQCSTTSNELLLTIRPVNVRAQIENLKDFSQYMTDNARLHEAHYDLPPARGMVVKLRFVSQTGRGFALGRQPGDDDVSILEFTRTKQPDPTAQVPAAPIPAGRAWQPHVFGGPPPPAGGALPGHPNHPPHHTFECRVVHPPARVPDQSRGLRDPEYAAYRALHREMQAGRSLEEEQPGPSRRGAWARHFAGPPSGTFTDVPRAGGVSAEEEMPGGNTDPDKKDDDETMDDQPGTDAGDGASSSQNAAAESSGESDTKNKETSEAKKDDEP